MLDLINRRIQMKILIFTKETKIEFFKILEL